MKKKKKAVLAEENKLSLSQQDEFLRKESAVHEYLAQGDREKAFYLAENLPLIEKYAARRARTRCVAALENCLLDEAEERAAEFFRLSPGGASRFFVVRIRFAKGERGELIGELKKALTEPMEKENIARCLNLLGHVYRSRGDAKNTVKYFFQSYVAAREVSRENCVVEYDNYLFNCHNLPYDPMELAKKHFAFDDLITMGGKLERLYLRRRKNIARGLNDLGEKAANLPLKRKIRLGYVSPDLKKHIVFAFSSAMFTYADHERFELFAYCHAAEDDYSQKVKKYFNTWRNIKDMKDEMAARVIAADDLDILVDLSGHTKGSVLGILAYKPAPVIISGIGYFSTTGLKAVDYFLSDRYLADAPEEGIYTSPYFTEKLIVLPNTHWCYTPLEEKAASSLEAPAKKNGYVTFGSFNIMAKVNDSVLAVWAAILEAVPTSRLLLKGEAFRRDIDREYNKNRLKEHGIDPERVEMRPLSKDYYEQYADVDIALDTFPYGGGGTTLDALYMSVPVISLIGSTHHSRFGYSILKNIGLAELAADTPSHYAERAVMLANDIDMIDALHKNIRTMVERSSLLDGRAYMKDLEAYYEFVAKEYKDFEEKPDSPTRPDYRDLTMLAAKMRQKENAGDDHQALALADMILSAEDHVSALRAAASCYIRIGQKSPEKSPFAKGMAKNAINAILRLKKRPSNYTAYDEVMLGYAFYLTGDAIKCAEKIERAIGEKEKGKKLDAAGQAVAYEALRLSYRQLGEAKKMTEAAKKAVEAIAQAREKGEEESFSRYLTLFDNYIYSLYFTEEAGKVHLDRAKEYAALIEAEMKRRGDEPYSYDEKDRARRYRKERIDLAIITPDLRRHIVCRFARAFFAFDRTRYNLTIYFTGLADSVTQDYSVLANRFIDLRQENTIQPKDIARRIHDDDIDILLELSGHSGGNSLFAMAYKPAPVIISAIGFMGTTGLKAVDYFLSDRHLAAVYDKSLEIEPSILTVKEEDIPYPINCCLDTYSDIKIVNSPDFTEKLLVLPHSHWSYDNGDIFAPYTLPPSVKNGYITFGSLNLFAKISDEMLALWGEIMHRLPDCHLYLKGSAFDEINLSRAKERLEAAGLDLARIEMHGYGDDYYAAYLNIDIALDAYPYGGGGTTADALFMGVPVIGFAGKRHGTRFTYSLLMNAHIADVCAADSAEEYIEKAVALAKEPKKIAKLRFSIRRRLIQTAVFDSMTYMADVERALEFVAAKAFAPIDGKEREEDISPSEESHKTKKKLAAELLSLTYEEKYKEAEPIAKRLTAYGDSLSVDELGAVGVTFYNSGKVDKAIAILLPLLALGDKTIRQGDEKIPALAKYIFHLSEALNDRCRHVAALAATWIGRRLLPKDPSPDDGDRRALAKELNLRTGVKILDLSYSAAAIRYYQEAMEFATNKAQQYQLYSNCLMLTNYGGATARERYLAHCRFAEILSGEKPLESLKKPPQKKEKLRIAYMSPDFRRHVMFWFIFQIICAHDRERFEVYCFMLSKRQDDYTDMIRERCDHFIDLHEISVLEDRAKAIRQENIDVLVDLAGHTEDGGVAIFKYRVAPVQISGLGYMTTTGLKETDFFLTDRYADPPEEKPEEYFTEKLLYLPSMFCYTGRSDLAASSGAPVKKTGYIQFASFNNYRKVNDRVLRLWKKIMDEVPKSQLLIKSQEFYDGVAVIHTYERLEALGFDVNRVTVEHGTTTYMERYLDVDIHLDTFPYPGGGTTADALYMGVPVIARRGEQHSSRFADSFLSSAGVPELLAADDDDYVKKAVALANDIDRLDRYHRELREKMLDSSLMDTPGYIAALEKAYRKYYDEWYDKN